MEKNEFQNKAYQAMIITLEDLELNGIYKGNGHHLAQRLCTLLWDKFKENVEPKIHSTDDIISENVKNILENATMLKMHCEQRGLEKLDAEKRGFGKNNKIIFVEFSPTHATIQVEDAKYDYDTAQVSLNIDEICMTKEQWKLHLQRL